MFVKQYLSFLLCVYVIQLLSVEIDFVMEHKLHFNIHYVCEVKMYSFVSPKTKVDIEYSIEIRNEKD